MDISLKPGRKFVQLLYVVVSLIHYPFYFSCSQTEPPEFSPAGQMTEKRVWLKALVIRRW